MPPRNKRGHFSTSEEATACQSCYVDDYTKLELVVVPVCDGKKFAFPGKLIHKHLAALLGLIRNPWSEPASKKTKKSADSSQSPPVVTLDTTILADLNVSSHMCEHYMMYRRTGHRCPQVNSFLIRTGASDYLYDQYHGPELAKEIVQHVEKYGISISGQVNFFSSQETEQYQWSADGKKLFLFTEEEDIRSLCKRIRAKVLRLDIVADAIGKGHLDVVTTILRNQSIPFYRATLLKDDEQIYY